MTRITILCFAILLVAATSPAAGPGWSWQVPLLPDASLYAVSAPDANTIVAVGQAGRILRTTDGGATWKQQYAGTTNSFISVSFPDANIGTVVGPGGTILRTIDGGDTWTSQ